MELGQIFLDKAGIIDKYYLDWWAVVDGPAITYGIHTYITSNELTI